MKKIYVTLVGLLMSVAGLAQGWPENYSGVMLQGFYWDSYADSKWTVLESQADELSQYFSLIWVPNSGRTSDYHYDQRNTMGYDPCFWLNHNSCWGTDAQLKSMIKAFADKGTGIIEDVVINHKNGLGSWVDFPDETEGSYSIKWDNTNYSGICQDDECNSSANLSKWSENGAKTTGAKDTGDNFDGYRDLDHTNATVQANVKIYLDFLLKELGYVGFRYDMVKGYAAQYTGAYNASAAPTYSVGEYWDGDKSKVTTWINGTKVDGKIQSAAFDFPLKYNLNSAFGGGTWSALDKAALASDPSYARYAVTFVDNHDTYREDSKLGTNVCAANAYILSLPGTPCLFLKHWQSNKGTLKRLIEVRRAVGIANQSTIESAGTKSYGYLLIVKGSKGKLALQLGNIDQFDAIDGYTEALAGRKFRVLVSSDVDLTAVKAVTDADESPEDDAPFVAPSFCVVNEGETCAFFEAPTSWGSTIYCWRWDNQYNYTSNSWPGVKCEKVGTTDKGKSVWKWTYKTSERKSQSSSNEGIIFNDGSNQTADLSFTNGGYYAQDGLQGVITTTGISDVKAATSSSAIVSVYTLDGRLLRQLPAGATVEAALSGLPRGLYIVNDQKYVKQ